MPAHRDYVSAHTSGVDLTGSFTMLNPPLTPPPEEQSQEQGHGRVRQVTQCEIGGTDDNTAAGMALSQEDAAYLSPASSPNPNMFDEKHGNENITRAERSETDSYKHSTEADVCRFQRNAILPEQIPQDSSASTGPSPAPGVESLIAERNYDHDSMDVDSHLPKERLSLRKPSSTTRVPFGLAEIDLKLNRSAYTRDWDFTQRRLAPKYPSSLFKAYSRYSGTQQSDKQRYNVDVTILTVDMEQCTLSGYLKIRDLTPEHEMLQTFFTGEIIGGPNQKYTFRTEDASWGATDRTDLIHWARFPAWRHLGSYAKRDLNFKFPLDNEPWWEQENIFMRWKEHFLVPDHKTRSIQGASFEGFYYICLNQLQGRITGIYFHSKSEKYQQLELMHEGQHGVWAPRHTPLMEFR